MTFCKRSQPEAILVYIIHSDVLCVQFTSNSGDKMSYFTGNFSEFNHSELIRFHYAPDNVPNSNGVPEVSQRYQVYPKQSDNLISVPVL